MKVKDLIEKLRLLDPEMLVVSRMDEWGYADYADINIVGEIEIIKDVDNAWAYFDCLDNKNSINALLLDYQ